MRLWRVYYKLTELSDFPYYSDFWHMAEIVNQRIIRLLPVNTLKFRYNKINERHVVLVKPEIHWNTGNIGRTCLGAGAHLHLIKPLGFSLSDRNVKRAGLDYWKRVKLSVWDDFASFMNTMKPRKEDVAVFTKNGLKSYRKMPQHDRMFLIFGSETRGLPESILKQFQDVTFYIPVTEDIRCLNLSTAVGIALYESLMF